MNRLSENKEVTQPLLYDIASDFNNGWPDPPLIKYTHRGKVSRPLHLPWSSRFCFEFVSFGCAFTSLPIPPFLSSLTSITWSSLAWIPSQSLPTLLASGTDRHRRLRQPPALTHPAYFSTQQGVLKKDSQARSNRILTGWEFSFVFFFLPTLGELLPWEITKTPKLPASASLLAPSTGDRWSAQARGHPMEEFLKGLAKQRQYLQAVYLH